MNKENGPKDPRDEIFLQPNEDPFEQGLPIHEDYRLKELNPKRRSLLKRYKGRALSLGVAAAIGVAGFLHNDNDASSADIALHDANLESIEGPNIGDSYPQSAEVPPPSSFWDNPDINRPERNEGMDGLESYYSGGEDYEELGNILKGRVVYAYKRGRDATIDSFHYNLITDYNPETIDYVNKEREEFVREGLNILQDYREEEKIVINEEDNTVSIPDSRSFDLSETMDLILLDQYIKHSLDHEEDKAEDILWFANNGIDLKIRNDAFLFIDDDGLVNYSRLLQIGDELGFPRADKLSYVPHSGEDTIIGKYFDKDLYANSDATHGTVVHEAAHDLASHHPEFNQEKFDEVVNNTSLGGMTDEERQESNGFVRDYGRKNNKEDYATVIEGYFVEGDSFRSRLRRFYLTDDPGYEPLKQKYNFAKSMFEGLEFSRNGEVFEIEEGEAYEVDIPNRKIDTRFVLNDTPSYILDSEVPKSYLKDQEEVVVLEVDEDKVENPFLNIQTNFVKVEIISENEEGEKELKTGWMDAFFLKNKQD